MPTACPHEAAEIVPQAKLGDASPSQGRRVIRWNGPTRLHDGPVTTRQEATRALYEGSLADVGDPNPYAGRSPILAKLWMRGYERMLRVRVESGPAIQRYLAASATAGNSPERKPH